MHTGQVIWFNDSKGFGLIEIEDGNTVFVHYSSIQGEGFRSLKQGQKVLFDLYEDDAKGFLAKNVVSC
ncbi:cold-shock protein [bacterium]|nr:cold-shock protein [bacterium]